MECRQCASPLERPGDYCLVCRTANADGVVIEADTDRARLTMLEEDTIVGETTVTTTPEDGDRARQQLRNFAGRVGDELRRKRPETVYLTGERSVVRAIQQSVRYECFRIDGDQPVKTAIERRGERALEVVDTAPAEKIGGTHSTLIGGRDGRAAIQTVAGHPHVKKIVPGPIDAGGTGSRSGLRAKATRADTNGNVRLLLRDGSSVQENRVVTTAMDVDTGERVRADLNDALAEADLQ